MIERPTGCFFTSFSEYLRCGCKHLYKPLQRSIAYALHRDNIYVPVIQRVVSRRHCIYIHTPKVVDCGLKDPHHNGCYDDNCTTNKQTFSAHFVGMLVDLKQAVLLMVAAREADLRKRNVFDRIAKITRIPHSNQRFRGEGYPTSGRMIKIFG